MEKSAQFEATSMPVETPFFQDPKSWVSISALLVAAWSAFNAVRSRGIAARALQISEGQDQRRQPKLGIYLINGYRRLVPNRQLFGFLVSVSNPTDINNSVVRVELQITYTMKDDVSAVLRIQHNAALGAIESTVSEPTASVPSLPLRIEAHQTVSGWLLFSLDNDAIRSGTVDAHILILEDTHGLSTKTDPIMVREWTDESKKD